MEGFVEAQRSHCALYSMIGVFYYKALCELRTGFGKQKSRVQYSIKPK